MKNLKPEEINVKIDSVMPYKNEKYEGICIKWYGNIGYGEYNLYKTNEEDSWHGDSECMDTNEDKTFLKMLFNDFVTQIEIK